MTYALDYGIRGLALPRKYQIDQGLSMALLPAGLHLDAQRLIPNGTTLKKTAAYAAAPIVAAGIFAAVHVGTPTIANPGSGSQHTSPQTQHKSAVLTSATPNTASNPSTDNSPVATPTPTRYSTTLDGLSAVAPVTPAVTATAANPTPTETASTQPAEPKPAPTETVPPEVNSEPLSVSVTTPVAQAGVDVFPPQVQLSDLAPVTP